MKLTCAIVSIFLFLILFLFIYFSWSEEIYFDLGSGMVKRKKVKIIFKDEETLIESSFSKYLKKNNLKLSEDWILVNVVKYNALTFSTTFYNMNNYKFKKQTDKLETWMEVNTFADIDSDIVKEKVKKFLEILKTRKIDEIERYVDNLEGWR